MGKSASTEKYYLDGDWSISGVVLQMKILMGISCRQNEPGHLNQLILDCSGIEKIDLAGLQLLYVWLQCAKIRGMDPSLHNIPDHIKNVLKRLDFQPESLGMTSLKKERNKYENINC